MSYVAPKDSIATPLARYSDFSTTMAANISLMNLKLTTSTHHPTGQMEWQSDSTGESLP